MKKIYLIITVWMVLASCNGFDDPQTGQSNVQELSLGSRVSGTISTVGKVDWYHYRAVEANNILRVNCSSNTYRSDIQLLATVYEQSDNGGKVRLYGDHAPENSQLPADIKMNIYIDRPKDLYISVRDLMDDGSSEYPYYLSIDFENHEEGNDNFSDALPLVVDDETGCQTDTIGYIGDVDCFRYTVSTPGVYGVQVDFSPFSSGTDVALSIDLYRSDGFHITSLEESQHHQYRLLPYLTPDDYYVVIDDYGRDDFDSASPYQICVTSQAVDEAYENDSRENAGSMSYTSSTGTYSASGSLDYLEDQDWYQIPLAGINSTGFKVLQVSFDDGDQGQQMNYQVDLMDTTGIVLMSHRFSGGSSAYVTQIKAGEGDHFIKVQAAQGQSIAQSSPYTLSVQVLDVQDPAETVAKVDSHSGETVYGNNTIDTADVLSPTSDPTQATIGKIGFRGDEDWYAVVIEDPTRPHILEVFLDTDSQPSLVDYQVSVIRDAVIKKIYDANGQDGGTVLKTSIFIPATTIASPLTYYFRVCDYQGDDGDGLQPYRFRVNIADIPDGLPPDSMISPSEAVYYSEADEKAGASFTSIRLEVNSLTQKTYLANTQRLYFNRLDPVEGVSKTVNPDQTTTIVFPWIAGYIDYEGDQDWFQLDLSPLIQAGLPLDSDWYYDIQIDLHTDAPGSPVEYIWKLYRDYNGNNILVDRPRDSDGFFASAGDTGTTLEPLEIHIPEAQSGQQFWVGDGWEGKFYLSVSDFNYVASPLPDDDWGYDSVPYYIRVTLVYHPGKSRPE